MQKIIVIVLALATFVVGAAVSYHNPQVVSLDYLLGTAALPLGTLVVGIMAVTILVMALLYWLGTLPRRAELARLRRRLNRAEDELASLRKLPLKDG